MTGNPNENQPPWLQRLKSNPAVVVVLMIVAVVIGFGSFTDALSKIGRFFDRDEPAQVEPAQVSPIANIPQPVVESKSNRDALLEKAIIGKWLTNSRLPTPSGIKVTELYNIFLLGGTYNSRGSYQYFFNTYPIMVSGEWEVIDGNLHFEVTSSNVPTAIAVGFKSYTELLSVDSGKMTYIDSADGNTKVDYKVN